MATEEKDYVIKNMNSIWSHECSITIEDARTMFDNLKKYETLCLVSLQEIKTDGSLGEIFMQPMRSGTKLKLIRTRHNCNYSMFDDEVTIIYRYLTASDIDMIHDVLIYNNNKYRICRIQSYTKKDWTSILGIK